MSGLFHILLAEQDEAIRSVIAAALTDSGYAVTVATSVEEAIAQLQADGPDLVITNDFSRLPAEALSTALPILHAAGTTPVILFTAHPIPDEVIRAAGFRDCLPKPLNLTDLDANVQAWLAC